MTKNRNNHAAVIGSTLITGGSQVASALIAFVRSKIAAVYVGPEGVGIIGLLMQLQAVLTTGFDLGVSNSAVREISLLRSKGDDYGLKQLVNSLFRLTCYAAMACSFLAIVLCVPLGRWMFNKDGHALDVALAGFGASLILLSGAYSTLQRGHGMVADLAIQRVAAAVTSTIAAYIGYRWCGPSAIPYVLAASAALAWFIAKARSTGLRQHSPEVGNPQIVPLVRHGLPFLWAGLLFAVVSYMIGALVVDYCGLGVSGNYQAAWGLTAYLVGFVLTAMGQDFLPRLSTVIHDKQEAVSMINSQIEIGVLFSLPGMFLFSAYADKSLSLFLSDEFKQAVPIAQCILIGCLGRVLNWPMLFALNAQRESKRHMIAVTVASLAYLVFAWVGLVLYGVIGAACGFALMQTLHFFWLRVVLSHTLEFRFSASVIVVSLLAVVSLTSAPFLQPFQAAVAFTALGLLSLWRLTNATGMAATIRAKIAQFFDL